jgi:hypothetical protein
MPQLLYCAMQKSVGINFFSSKEMPSGVKKQRYVLKILLAKCK